MKGTYILVILLREDSNIQIGALGTIFFRKGFYFYIGSAMSQSGSTTLLNRVKRHLLPPSEKKTHWHIDYLLENENASIVQLKLIPCRQKLECLIAQEFIEISKEYIKDFGSSDCNCLSHLVFSKENDIYNKIL